MFENANAQRYTIRSLPYYFCLYFTTPVYYGGDKTIQRLTYLFVIKSEFRTNLTAPR